MFNERHNLILHAGMLCCLTLGFTAGFAAGAAADGDQGQADATAEITESEAEELKELSIAPLEYPQYPDDRPVWVDQPNEIEKDWAELVVLSVPSVSNESSLRSLTQQERVMLNAYLDSYLKVPGAGEQLDYTTNQIDRLVDRQRTYDGKLTVEDGDMHQHAAVLVLDQEFHGQVKQRWKEMQQSDRLKGVGLLGASAFVVLAGMTAFLRTISPKQTTGQPHDQ